MAKCKRYNLDKGAYKIYRVNNEWVDTKPMRPVLSCLCGSRYIKTRRGQKGCIPCIGGFKLSTLDRSMRY